MPYLTIVVKFRYILWIQCLISFVASFVVRFRVSKVSNDRVITYCPRRLAKRNTCIRINHSWDTVSPLTLTCITSWVSKPTPNSQCFDLDREIVRSSKFVYVNSSHKRLFNYLLLLKNEISEKSKWEFIQKQQQNLLTWPWH